MRPLLVRGRAWLTAPLADQLRLATTALHASVDAGVVALAARASVLDAAVARGARSAHPAGSIAGRLDALDAGLAALAGSMQRLDSQQRLIFDGLLDELALAQRDWGQLAAQQRAGHDAALATLDRVAQYSAAGARRVAVGVDGDVLVRSEAGYIVCAGADLAVLATLIESGDLERGTRRLIEALLAPGDCFVDVGAHIGMHTLAAGRALQGRGVIHAFEPYDATRQQLQKSVWLNGLAGIATVHASAVSDRAGAAPLYLGAGSGHHSLYALAAAGGAQVTVPTVRLDDVIAQPVTLVKIDAEGAELDVLAGARRIVAENPDMALIVECGPAHLLRRSHTIDGWLAAFEALGLTWRAIDPVTGALADATPAQLAAAESTNLLFARAGAPCWTCLLEQP